MRLNPLGGQLERLARALASCNDLPRALQTTLLNKVPPEDRKVIGEAFDHHVGPTAAGRN